MHSWKREMRYCIPQLGDITMLETPVIAASFRIT
ncbi:hypothetical protein OROGR_017453 [Orobanche gracilis]